jgi:hypothetical protein
VGQSERRQPEEIIHFPATVMADFHPVLPFAG